MTAKSYYEIRAHPYKFHAIVQPPTKNKVWRIQVGGYQTCVIFNVEEWKGQKTAYLEGASFSPDCTVDKNLVRGSGTKRLLKASLTFLFELMPDVNEVYFQDTSYIDCNIQDVDKTIRLHMYYIAKKGRTWYEETVNARLDGEPGTLYEQQKQKALGVYKEKYGFEEFQRLYMRSIADVFPEDVMDIIKRAYTTHETYGAMFAELAKDYDCSIMYGWLDRYFRKNVPILFQEVEWHVSRDGFEPATIETVKMSEAPAMTPLTHRG